MYTWGITLIFIITNIVAVRGAAVPNSNIQKSIYDVLVEYSKLKCPYLKKTKLLEPKPEFLDKCSNYDSIKSIKSLSLETGYDVLCLLYYNNYMSLCDTLPNNFAIQDNTGIDKRLTYFTLQNTCKYLKNSKFITDLTDMEGIMSGIWASCDLLCGGKDGVLPVCSFAAVFLNLTEQIQSEIKTKAEKSQPNKALKTEESTAEKSEPHSAGVKPKVADSNKSNDGKSVGDSTKNQTQNVPPKQTKLVANADNEKPKQTQPDVQVEGVNGNIYNLDKTGHKTEVKVAGVIRMGEKPFLGDGDKLETGTKQKQQLAEDQDKSKLETDTKQTQPLADDQDKSKPKTDTKQTQLADDQDKIPKALENPDIQTNKVETAPKLPEETKENASPAAVQENKPADEDIDIDREDMDPQLNDPQNTIDDSREEDFEPLQEPEKVAEKVQPNTKPQEIDEDAALSAYNSSNTDEEDSFFFIYFMMVCAVFILGYIGYHNKQKVLALVIEGRRGRRGSRRGRPNSANYHKLDSNLEEAVTSACNKNTTNIIY